MEDLIKALKIFAKYTNTRYPLHCEHDVLYIWGVEPSEVSDEDLKQLEKLDFFVSDGVDEGIISYRFGSC